MVATRSRWIHARLVLTAGCELDCTDDPGEGDPPAYQAILRLRTDHREADVIFAQGVGPDYDPAQTAKKLWQVTAFS